MQYVIPGHVQSVIFNLETKNKMYVCNACRVERSLNLFYSSSRSIYVMYVCNVCKEYLLPFYL